jgi:hypothetical protein
MGDRKISEDEFLRVKDFSDKLVIPFLFEEEYEDWKYARKMLHTNDRLLVLVNNRASIPSMNNHKRNEYNNLQMKHFRIFIFETCDHETAEFAGLNFDKNKIYTIIGGINIIGSHNLPNNYLGRWYDFALPRIKLNLPASTKVLFDLKEIAFEDGQIDLSNLVLKETKTPYPLEPGEHSLKCNDISPAYFFVEEAKPNTNAAINRGWIITPNDLRPVKSGEKPSVVGLIIKSLNKTENINMRPFLSRINHLQNRPLEGLLNKKIRMLEGKKNYGY